MADAENVPEHFIGGHPALDLANAVFNRWVPEPDNELLKSATSETGSRRQGLPAIARRRRLPG